MEKDESREDILMRLLASLPPAQLDLNQKAIENISEEDDELDPLDFDFKELEDAKGNTFFACDYALHPEEDDVYRSPHTCRYVPGDYLAESPVVSAPTYIPVEQNVIYQKR